MAGVSAPVLDLPPAYNDDGEHYNARTRQAHSTTLNATSNSIHAPTLDVIRHQTQGGFIPAKIQSPAVGVKLSLNLHQENRFKAGDVVSGSVDLTSEQVGGQSLDVGSISVIFSGRCKTSKPVREGSLWRRQCTLFTFKETVLTGPLTLHVPNRSTVRGVCPSFPFHFTFPLDCRMSDMEDFETGPFFHHDTYQTLPASFADDNVVERASVVYEIKGELLAPDFQGYFTRRSIFQLLSLNVHTTRDVEEPSAKFVLYSTSFTHQSLDLLPAMERKFHERPMTLGQKLGIRSISKSNQPKACFKTTVLIPSLAIVGQPIPLMLHIDHDSQNSTVIPSPIIHLNKAQLFLRSETSICGIKHKSTHSEYDQTGWTSNAKITGKDFSKAMPIVDYLDLRDMMDLTLDPNLPPSFRTFNIARTYSLRFTCAIICGGKSFTVGSPMIRCTLLAKDYAPRLPQYGEIRLVTIDADEDRPANQVPPPYSIISQFQNEQRSRLRGHSSSVGRRSAFRGGAAGGDGGAVAAVAVAASCSSSGGGGGGGVGC